MITSTLQIKGVVAFYYDVPEILQAGYQVQNWSDVKLFLDL
tara:strand:- start:429 stop:551 length:123 start_codon:yes stop_codon:yes gene_type:complete